ncbi:MAG: hypothetical protein M1840_000586 [Geoglossum simile]|nr:MAG: hypothetical protein M1840_000586 [Geoglossum simile]
MVLLEVEQKFCFSPSLVRLLHLNKGNPPFSSLRYLGTNRFHDAYFDRTSHTLAHNSIWIRRRDARWEAKRRTEGDFIRSAFEEINSPGRIHDLICRYLPGSPNAQENFGLDMYCQFRTTRETYLADRKFSIMLDKTDFGHSVGEVEVEAEDAVEALREINAFMDKYPWFFQKERPKSKLTAYFERFPLHKHSCNEVHDETKTCGSALGKA